MNHHIRKLVKDAVSAMRVHREDDGQLARFSFRLLRDLLAAEVVTMAEVHECARDVELAFADVGMEFSEPWRFAA